MAAQDAINALRAAMERYLTDHPDEIVDLIASHPRPWTWMATYHDGAGIQFMDAAGVPVLCGLIYDVETAADLLKTINGKLD